MLFYVHIKDMIPGVNIREKASINEAGSSGGGGAADTLCRYFRGQSPLRTFLGSKEHLDWLKIYSNVAKIITVSDYKCTKN